MFRHSFMTLIVPIVFALVASACSESDAQTKFHSVYTGIGSEISLRGMNEVCCGSDYEFSKHHYNINLRNTSLPWGTRVFLHYGFKSIELDAYADNAAQDWQVAGWAPFSAVAPYSWRIELTQIIHERGQSKRLSDLQFVIKIVYPNGGDVFERGSESRLGFFEGKDPSHSASCRNSRERDPNGWCDLRIAKVERD